MVEIVKSKSDFSPLKSKLKVVMPSQRRINDIYIKIENIWSLRNKHRYNSVFKNIINLLKSHFLLTQLTVGY